MAIEAILFDKDGVLLDYQQTFGPLNRKVALAAADGDAQLADALLAHCGHDLVRDEALPGSLIAVGTVSEIASAMVGHLGPQAKPGLRDHLVALFNEGPDESFMVAGCDDALRTLKQSGYAMGIATNDSAVGLEITLRPHAILPYFDFVAGYDSGHGGKPEPGMALAFCETCNVAPAHMAMVGDNAHDIESGRRAGAGLCIGVLTGASGWAELEPISDLVLGSIAELPGHPILQSSTH